MELREAARHGLALHLAFRWDRLEMPTAHDLEALLDAGRTPRRLHAPEHRCEAHKCLFPAQSTKLDAGVAHLLCWCLLGDRQLTTRSARGTARTASVSACAKSVWASMVPAGKGTLGSMS